MSAGVCSIGTCGRKLGRSDRGGRLQLCPTHNERRLQYGDPLAGPPILDRRPDRREYVIGEVEWFMSFGVSPELTASALGYTDMASIARVLDRWGRADLAEHFITRIEENWAAKYRAGKLRGAA